MRPFSLAAVAWLAIAVGLRAAPPVILISIDTLRADHVGAYGYRHIATPNIDSFAQGGTVFTNIACQTPLTLPSHTSLFTSTYPFENGIQENAELVPQGAVTLASVLKSHGYKTAAFIGSVFLERQMGLDQGFDTYDSPFNFEAFSHISGDRSPCPAAEPQLDLPLPPFEPQPFCPPSGRAGCITSNCATAF